MKSLAAILFASIVSLLPLCAQSTAIETNTPRPKLLLDPDFAWRKQSGEWTPGAGSISATAGATLSEYAASSGVAMKGRWVSVRITLEGDLAKAGLWFAGIRDEKGDIVRFTLDAASGTITNSRGKTIATLPASTADKPVDLLFRFSTEDVKVLAGGEQIAEMPVKFEESTATPSLVVERGRATFSDLLLGTDVAPVPLTKKAPPKAIPPKIIPVRAPMNVDFTGANMTKLKATWQEYFGIHTETTPGPWKTVRQFDGPALGLPKKQIFGSQKLDGPFNQTPVEMNLSWFRDQSKRTSLGLDLNLSVIVRNDCDAVFIAPWRSMLGKTQQDEIWALLKLAYSANPGAEKRLFFQWGDDINAQRLGTSADAKNITAAPHNGVAYGRNASQPTDAAAYAENYFAPAVEAVRKASADVFGDERRIPVMLGSCARAGLDANRDWYRSVLEHPISGELAPSLKGKRVIELTDYLTVNYPFSDAPSTKGLQSLWNDYGKRVKGLWITEEFGSLGRGPTQITNRAALFLEWVAANELTAQQARLIWNLGARKRASDESVGLMLKLGERMNGALQFGMDASDIGSLYKITAGQSKLLLVFIPKTERKGIRPGLIGDIAVEVGEDRAKNPWLARYMSLTTRKVADELVPMRVERNRVILTPTALNIAPWAVLLEMP